MSLDQVFERSALPMCLEIDHRIDGRKNHKKSQAKRLVIHERRRSSQESIGTLLFRSPGLQDAPGNFPQTAGLLIGLFRIKLMKRFGCGRRQ